MKIRNNLLKKLSTILVAMSLSGCAAKLEKPPVSVAKSKTTEVVNGVTQALGIDPSKILDTLMKFGSNLDLDPESVQLFVSMANSLKGLDLSNFMPLIESLLGDVQKDGLAQESLQIAADQVVSKYQKLSPKQKAEIATLSLGSFRQAMNRPENIEKAHIVLSEIKTAANDSQIGTLRNRFCNEGPSLYLQYIRENSVSSDVNQALMMGYLQLCSF